MVRRAPSQLPELVFDSNAHITKKGYVVTLGDNAARLERLGLTFESALGRRFTFAMEDCDERGEPDDLLFDGTIIRHDVWRYLSEIDDNGFYHRSELADA